MNKFAQILLDSSVELSGKQTVDSELALAAIDFSIHDSADLVRVASLLVAFANQFDLDSKVVAADLLDAVIKTAADSRFWVEPKFKGEKVPPDRESLGPLGHTLQTRYSPDLPGVSLVRVSDGVYKDPVTDKIYDFNKGFKLDNGSFVPGGSVSAQSPNPIEIKQPIKQQIKIK